MDPLQAHRAAKFSPQGRLSWGQSLAALLVSLQGPAWYPSQPPSLWAYKAGLTASNAEILRWALSQALRIWRVSFLATSRHRSCLLYDLEQLPEPQFPYL